MSTSVCRPMHVGDEYVGDDTSSVSSASSAETVDAPVATPAAMPAATPAAMPTATPAAMPAAMPAATPADTPSLVDVFCDFDSDSDSVTGPSTRTREDSMTHRMAEYACGFKKSMLEMKTMCSVAEADFAQLTANFYNFMLEMDSKDEQRKDAQARAATLHCDLEEAQAEKYNAERRVATLENLLEKEKYNATNALKKQKAHAEKVLEREARRRCQTEDEFTAELAVRKAVYKALKREKVALEEEVRTLKNRLETINGSKTTWPAFIGRIFGTGEAEQPTKKRRRSQDD